MKELHLPHSVIVRATGLLPMDYTVKELAQLFTIPESTLRGWLRIGAPHKTDDRNRVWVDGRSFATWVDANRKRKACGRKLTDEEAYCLKCREAVQLVNPRTIEKQGALILIQGQCPLCGHTINRGGRHAAR